LSTSHKASEAIEESLHPSSSKADDSDAIEGSLLPSSSKPNYSEAIKTINEQDAKNQKVLEANEKMKIKRTHICARYCPAYIYLYYETETETRRRRMALQLLEDTAVYNREQDDEANEVKLSLESVVSDLIKENEPYLRQIDPAQVLPHNARLQDLSDESRSSETLSGRKTQCQRKNHRKMSELQRRLDTDTFAQIRSVTKEHSE
jgi:hypothetical protein